MSSNVVRWGGVAGVVAAVMWVLSFILIQLTSLPRVFESISDYLIEVVLLVGYAGTMGAIVGLHALQSHSGRYGRLGALGSLLTFIGYAIVFVVTTRQMHRITEQAAALCGMDKDAKSIQPRKRQPPRCRVSPSLRKNARTSSGR
jgi:hypothetical protein